MVVGKHLEGRGWLYFSPKENAAKPSPVIPSEEVELHVALGSNAQVGRNLAACSQLFCTASHRAYLPQVPVGAPSFLEAHGNLSSLPCSSRCCIHHPETEETRSTISGRRAREASTRQTTRRAFPAVSVPVPLCLSPTCPRCRRLFTRGRHPLGVGSDILCRNGSPNPWEPERDAMQYWGQARRCQEFQAATATSSETRAEENTSPWWSDLASPLLPAPSWQWRLKLGPLSPIQHP